MNSKPWPVAFFEKERPHLTTFVRERVLPLLETADCCRIVIRAPVKSGKREIVEYIAQRDAVTKPKRVHAFLSAWHRSADADQREELKEHNMEVFSITTADKADKCVAWILAQIAAGLHVVIHLDECDHGSGAKQILSKVWASTRDKAGITNILYSATPQEILFSGEVEDEEHQAMMTDMIEKGEHIEYVPPEGYCGPAAFLDAGLVEDAIPFFYAEPDEFTLSAQGRQIVSDLLASLATPEGARRNMIVLRLSYSALGGSRTTIKENKAIHQFLTNITAFPELKDFIVVVDKHDATVRSTRINAEQIQWSNSMYWRRQAAEPTILVIDQTSSRSTEWACHDRVYAVHDFRNTIQYSTISQAQERVNHYRQRYGAFQPIRVFGHKKTFMLSAGLIDYATYLTHEWEKKKVDRRTAGDVDLYKVRRTSNHRILHGDCPATGLLEVDADRLLQSLGCFADLSLSARVAGRIVDKPVYAAAWVPCTPDTFVSAWSAFCASPPTGFIKPATVRNPFDAASDHRTAEGLWQGFHRKWAVMDFDADFTRDIGWGAKNGTRVKVCYRGGELGIAIVWPTGIERVDSLRAYKSMYGSRI